MKLTAQDFENIGFWEDVTPEEQIIIYGMDLDSCYLILTDELGKTPAEDNKIIVVAAYDDNDCFLWGKELKNFAALKEICLKYADDENALLAALQNYTLPKK